MESWVVVLRWIILAGINHIGGVVVRVLTSWAVDGGFESPDRVKLRTLFFNFYLLNRRYIIEKEQRLVVSVSG
jgi:hypothetical protein